MSAWLVGQRLRWSLTREVLQQYPDDWLPAPRKLESDMTGKRSSGTRGTPNAAMQAWMSSGLTGLDMFGEGAPQADEPSGDCSPTSGSAPPGHCDDGASADAASMPVELQLISKKVVECSATIDAELARFRGPVKDAFIPRASEIAVVLKDLCSTILDIQPNAVGSASLLEVKLGTEKSVAASGVSLTLPGEFRDVIASQKFRASMEAFISLIDDDRRHSKECAALLAASGASESISAAAIKLRQSIGSADLRDGLVLASPAWAEQIPLPQVIAAPEEQKKNQIDRKVKGAFRGYFISKRIAHFEEKSGRRAEHDLNFDEKKFFKIVQRLSQPEFICCTVCYIEHRVGEKVDRLELKSIAEVQPDLYEDGEQFNREVEKLLAELNASPASSDMHATPAK